MVLSLESKTELWRKLILASLRRADGIKPPKTGRTFKTFKSINVRCRGWCSGKSGEVRQEGTDTRKTAKGWGDWLMWTVRGREESRMTPNFLCWASG